MSNIFRPSFSKILTVLGFLSVVLYHKYNVTRIWTPEKLSYSNSERIVDPEDYLIYESRQTILDRIRKIQKDTIYNVRVYIISEISDDYIEIRNNKKKKNVSLFLDELANIVLKENRDEEPNSIFILFSVSDLKMRIRTGDNVKNKLNDRKCGLFLKSVKNTFGQKNYEKAILTILEKMNSRLISGFLANLQEDIYEVITSIIALIVVVSIVIGILTILVKMLSKEEITEDIGNTKKITFNESECFVCRKEIKKTKLDEEFAAAKVFKVTLYCDHSFHYNCITKWMENNTKCPLCDNIDNVCIVERSRSKTLLEKLPLKMSKKCIRTSSFSD
jgi:uncharacterized membrane protein YgcG